MLRQRIKRQNALIVTIVVATIAAVVAAVIFDLAFGELGRPELAPSGLIPEH